MAVIDPSIAIFAIVLLIICAVVLRSIYRRRRLNIPTREVPYGYANSAGSRGLYQLTHNRFKIIAAAATLIVVIIFLSESVVIVQAGHRGVILNLGAVENRVLGEGIHFIVPFAEQVIQLEVRTLKYQAEASAASNDLQQVQTVIALNYHLNPSDANAIYQQLGSDYADRIIAPTIQEAVKASVAKFDAEELITKREIAKGVIAEAIRNTLSARDIIVETVFITDFQFSEAFANQIESKVVAFQKYLTEQNNLKAITVVANQTVVQAQALAKANVAKAGGESQAIKIITSQLRQDPQYLQWQAINKWNGQMPYSFGGGGTLPFFQMPVQTGSTAASPSIVRPNPGSHSEMTVPAKGNLTR